MKQSAGFILIFFMLMVTKSNAQTVAEKQVAAAVKTLTKAMIDGDKAALEMIASDALSYGHSSGKIQDKDAFVDAIVSGQSDFVTIDLTDQTVTVDGNIAIVRHKFAAQTNDGGKQGTVNLGIMLVWAKEKNAWKLLARQAYKL